MVDPDDAIFSKLGTNSCKAYSLMEGNDISTIITFIIGNYKFGMHFEEAYVPLYQSVTRGDYLG